MKLLKAVFGLAFFALAGCVTYPYQSAFDSCDEQAGACYRYCEDVAGNASAYSACHADCDATANQCFASAYDSYAYSSSYSSTTYYGSSWPWYGRYGAWGPSSGYYFDFTYWGGYRDYDRRHKRRYDYDRRRDYDRDRSRRHRDRDYDGDRRYDRDRSRDGSRDRGRDRDRSDRGGARPPQATPGDNPNRRLTPRQRRYQDTRPQPQGRTRSSGAAPRQATPPPASSPAPSSPPQSAPPARTQPSSPPPRRSTPRQRRYEETRPSRPPRDPKPDTRQGRPQ